jgi:hypothetical protein
MCNPSPPLQGEQKFTPVELAWLRSSREAVYGTAKLQR